LGSITPPARGDLNPDAIHVEVGRALTLWEGIEDELADIFALLTGGSTERTRHPAKRAYGVITNFTSRKAMVLEAAKAYFGERADMGMDTDKPLQAALTTLLNTCAKFSGRRNEIAHGQVKRIELYGPLLDELGIAADDTWYLMPPGYNSRKSPALPRHLKAKGDAMEPGIEKVRHFVSSLVRDGLGAFKYNAEQVRHYRDCFDGLSVEARAIADRPMALPDS
jgi:hypothetical protein